MEENNKKEHNEKEYTPNYVQTTQLDDVIKTASFPDDYDLFDDELLDMIP